MLVLACAAGAAGAACGTGVLLLWQRVQRRHRRRRRASTSKLRERMPQLRLHPATYVRSPWESLRARMPASNAAAGEQPPTPLARALLARAVSGVPSDGGILARVSSDAPCLAMSSPFACCAAQSSEPGHSPGQRPASSLPPAGEAVLAAAAAQALLAGPAPASPAPLMLSLNLRSCASSVDAGQLPRAGHLPAYSPCVRVSMDGCPTPGHCPPTPLPPSLESSEGVPCSGNSAAVPSDSDSRTQHSSTLAAPASLAEQLAAEPGAPPTVPVAAPLDAGALPDALRGCLVHPSEICFLHWPGEPLQPLGEGASATVFRATLHGQEVAVKVMHVGHSVEAQQAFVMEAARMQQLRHKHIVGFLGVSLDGPNAMLVMEYCAGRDLFSSLQLHADDGSERRLFGWCHRGRRVALQLAEALAHLHSLSIVHMDVKSSNVLLAAGHGTKLCDVGLSRLLGSMHLSSIACTGTFAWAAPEVLLGGHDCGHPADIYSFGVVLWELLTGERPVRGHLRLPMVPKECPQDVCDLMLRCLSTDPRSRPTADQLVTHLEALVNFGPAQAAAAGASAS